MFSPAFVSVRLRPGNAKSVTAAAANSLMSAQAASGFVAGKSLSTLGNNNGLHSALTQQQHQISKGTSSSSLINPALITNLQSSKNRLQLSPLSIPQKPPQSIFLESFLNQKIDNENSLISQKDSQILKAIPGDSPYPDISENPNPARFTGEGADEKPDKEILEDLMQQLIHQTQVFLISTPDITIYHPEIFYENFPTGEKLTGLANYKIYFQKLKIYAHLRYSWVKPKVISASYDEDESIIEIKFEIRGIGPLKMAWNYIPKKLFRESNLEEYANVWVSGISTYLVNGNGQITRHIFDDREVKKPEKSKADELVEKLQKLKPAPAQAAPNL